MVSITAIALGISVVTTSLLTLHDSLKQIQHGKGFATFLLTQNIQSNAKYALNCITNTIEQRYTQKGEQIKNNIFNASFDFVNQSFNVLQQQIQKKLKLVSVQSLIEYIREQQLIIDEDQRNKNIDIEIDKLKQNKQAKNVQNGGIFSPFLQKFNIYKSLLRKQFDKQLDYYLSITRKKQKQTLLTLYNIYRQNLGIKNDLWITPYNFVMMLLLGISSFFIPKLTIILAISYFISSQLYLLSDTISAATDLEIFKDLKFQNMFEFHLAVLGSFAGYNRWKMYKGQESNLGSNRYKGMSLSF